MAAHCYSIVKRLDAARELEDSRVSSIMNYYNGELKMTIVVK